MFVLCRNTNTGRLTVKDMKKVNSLADEVLYAAETKEDADNVFLQIIAYGVEEYRKQKKRT